MSVYLFIISDPRGIVSLTTWELHRLIHSLSSTIDMHIIMGISPDVHVFLHTESFRRPNSLSFIVSWSTVSCKFPNYLMLFISRQNLDGSNKSQAEKKNKLKWSLFKRKICFHLREGSPYRRDLIFFSSLLQKYTKRFFKAFCSTILGSEMLVSITDTSVSSVSADLQNIFTTYQKNPQTTKSKKPAAH